MVCVSAFLQVALTALWVQCTSAQLHPADPATYVPLPSLREQAAIQDGWRDERLTRIPALLNKYRIPAWLVSYIYKCFLCPTFPLERYQADNPQCVGYSTRIRRGHHLVVCQIRDRICPAPAHSPPLPHQHLIPLGPAEPAPVGRQYRRGMARTAFHARRIRPPAHRAEHGQGRRVRRRAARRRVRGRRGRARRELDGAHGKRADARNRVRRGARARTATVLPRPARDYLGVG